MPFFEEEVIFREINILLLLFFFLLFFVNVFLFTQNLFSSLIFLEVIFLTSSLIIALRINVGQYVLIIFILGIGVLSACVGLSLVIKRANNFAFKLIKLSYFKYENTIM